MDEQEKVWSEILQTKFEEAYPDADETSGLYIDCGGKVCISIPGFPEYGEPKLRRLKNWLKENHIPFECDKWDRLGVRIPTEIPRIIKIPQELEGYEEFARMTIVDGIIIDGEVSYPPQIEGEVKHLDFDGGYPSLCCGRWTIQIGGYTLYLKGFLESQGFAGYDAFDSPTEGGWEVRWLPEWLKPFEAELKALANENIPKGCCNGCSV